MAALAAEAPDPKTFKTWEDAFKYPVPTVRRLQQQLRGDISSNRERLRTLVGGSYRELLGTADTIVQMDAQMQEVETHLGETSAKCNTSRLGRSFRNQAKLAAQTKDAERERLAAAAQLAVLQRCPEALVRVVKRGGSVLQAAKILIIARRLYRKLAEGAHAPAYVERVWARLGRLRQKVLRVIDRRLVSTASDAATLVDALCAHALAASAASATDLLRHFHHVRMDALTNAAAKDENGGEHAPVLESLRLWIRTLQDTRTIFPKQLAAALSRLKSAPILKDESIQSILELDLDIHEAWLGEDVRNFMPYLRHDDLSVATASQQLSAWAPAALKTLLANVKQALDSVDDLKKVDELRRGCLELLFSHYHVPGVRRNVVLGGFRETFENKLLELVRKRCEGLSGVSDQIEALIESGEVESSMEQPADLWSDELLSMDTSKGATSFTSAVQTALEGRTPAVQRATESYHAWLATVEAISAVAEGMRRIKWEDHLDELSDSDSSDSESEQSRRAIQTLLKVDDPAALDAAFARSLAASVASFVSAVSALAGDDASPARAAFLLRIIRAAKRRPPPAPSASSAPLDFTCVPRLHSQLAGPPVTAALARSALRAAAAARRSPAGRALWEGEPARPALPSPWAVRLLRDLERELARAGSDVWTSDAAHVARAKARSGLGAALAGAIDTGPEDGAEKDDEKSAEGETEGEMAGSMGRDAAIQLLFDLSFLGGRQAAESEAEGDQPAPENDELSALEARAEKIAGLDGTEVEGVRAAAAKYKERTALLFPLANGGG